MKTPSPAVWHRLGEVALLSTVFLLPLAVYFRTYDSAALKLTTLQLGVLVLGFAWFLQGLARGRWEAPASSGPALVPALAFGAWLLLRWAAAPHKLEALPGFLPQLLMVAGYLAVLVNFGGARPAARLSGALAASGWLVALYALAQRFGLDPLIWKGAFGARAFSTLAQPDLCAEFLALTLPPAMAMSLDEETHPGLRLAALSLLPAASAAVIVTQSATGLLAFAAAALAWGFAAPAALRSKAAARSGAAALVVAGATVAAAFLFDGAALARRARADWTYGRATVASELRMARAKPWAGWGPGSFFMDYPAFRDEDARRASGGGHNALTEFPVSRPVGVLVELGAVGAALWLWLFGAALWSALRGASALRREGRFPEAAYAAGFFAAAVGALAAETLSNSGSFAAPGFLLWPVAGMAAGLAPLSVTRGRVAAYPFPVDDSVRRMLHVPVLLALFALAAPPALWLRSDVEQNVAIYHAKRGDYAQAVEHFERVLPGAPAYPMALYFKGNALLDAGLAADAVAAYETLGEFAPDYVRRHMQLGLAYAKLERWGDAESEHARQAALDPTDVPNLIAWAGAARAGGDLIAARRAVALALDAAPDDPAVKTALIENALMEKRVADQQAAAKRGGRKATALRKSGSKAR